MRLSQHLTEFGMEFVRSPSSSYKKEIAVGILEKSNISEDIRTKSVHRGGFEPPPPKREQLKCPALDHSAIGALQNTR